MSIDLDQALRSIAILLCSLSYGASREGGVQYHPAGFGARMRRDITKMNIGYNGLWGLLILAGDVWAIINIVQSSVSNEKKLIWIVAVLVLPLLGLILWFFLGPRDRKA
jgi:hypothetical protein